MNESIVMESKNMRLGSLFQSRMVRGKYECLYESVLCFIFLVVCVTSTLIVCVVYICMCNVKVIVCDFVFVFVVLSVL